jgi:hypothetical protein
MTVESQDGGDKNVQILAEKSVVFDLLVPNLTPSPVKPAGEVTQKVHGKCEQAVYNYNVTADATNDVVRLTGNPVLVTTNGTLRNDVLILDNGNKKLIAPGKYRLQGLASAAGTNLFHFPAK